MVAQQTRKVLIPAAGFGRRVGSPPAKELLIDSESGEPLIEYSIRLAIHLGAQPVVITRSAKQSLIRYLELKPEVETLCIESSREWPHTLILAEELWGSHNVVILPDTRFLPTTTPQLLFSSLEDGKNVVFATFNERDLSVWGCVAQTENGIIVSEKPTMPSTFSSAQPWGVFGFHRSIGMTLLSAMLESCSDHSWKAVDCLSHFTSLDMFCDLTRSL